MKINKKIFFLTFIVFIIGFFGFVNRTSAELLVSEDNLIFKLQPKFPKANENVSITLESYVVDLNRKTISWFEDGVLKSKGVGLKNFKFNSSELGSSKKIEVYVVSDNIGLMTKTTIIRPAEVDLIWEVDSFVPPLYKGKALNSHQSDIKIVAMPTFIMSNGTIFNSKDLIYRWKKDWKTQTKASGYGRNTFIIEKPQSLRDIIINLEVESLDGSLKAVKTIKLKNHDTKIIFYEENPILGTRYNRAITDKFILTNDEVIIKAYPFFFSKEDIKRNNLDYIWTMNNKKIESEEKDTLVVRQSGTDTGVTNLRLKIQNISRIMQSARNSFRVNFSGITNDALFGTVSF